MSQPLKGSKEDVPEVGETQQFFEQDQVLGHIADRQRLAETRESLVYGRGERALELPPVRMRKIQDEAAARFHKAAKETNEAFGKSFCRRGVDYVKPVVHSDTHRLD
jgi:hypothetical protein